MKKILIGLIALISFSKSFGQSAGNDTTKYVYYKFTYGNALDRYWARKVLIIPADTIYSKDGLAMKNGTLYVGNGTSWSQVTGGGGGIDSAVIGANGVIISVAGSVRTAKADTFFVSTRSRLQKVLDSIALVNAATYRTPLDTSYAHFLMTRAWGYKINDSMKIIDDGRYVINGGNVGFWQHVATYAGRPTTGTGFFYADDSTAFYSFNGSTAINLTGHFNLYAKKDGGRGIMMLRGADSSFYMKGLVDSLDLHCVLNPDSTVTCYIGLIGSKGSRVMTDPVTGLMVTQAEILHPSVKLATAAALPTNTYNNGTSGVGATLTGISNGALSIDGVAVAVNDRILVKNEASAADNGIYTVTQPGNGSTPYILTRGNYSAIPANMAAGSHVFVNAGNTNANLIYYQQTTGTVTIGTTNLFYTLQGGFVYNLGNANGVQVGTLGARPSATGSHNFYLSTTDSTLYYDNGAWFPVGHTTGGGAGTVTNVATGWGLLGGPITSTGTLIGDSTKVTSIYQDGLKIVKPNYLGTLYAKSTWANTSDFTTIGSQTFAASGGKLSISGGTPQQPSAVVGTNNAAFTQVEKITAYGGTMLEQNLIIDTLIINNTPGLTTYGEGVGTYSITASPSNAIAYFNASTTTGAGTVSLLLGNSNTTAAISPTALTFSNLDTIIISYQRIYDRVIASARNQTTKATPVSCAYTYDQSSASNILTPNTSNYALVHFGGAYIHTGINVSSNETIGATIVMGGDSKFAGYATPWDQRVGALLNQRFPGVVVSAGEGDRTVDFIAHLPEFLRLCNGTSLALFCIGRNDIAGGVSTSVLEANLDTIADRTLRSGSQYYSLDAIFETNTAQTALINFMDSAVRFGAAIPTKLIQVYANGNFTGNVAIDGVHENYNGARIVAERIETDLIFNAINTGKFLATRDPALHSVTAHDSMHLSGTLDMNGLNNNNLFYTPTIFRTAGGGDIIMRAGTGIIQMYGANNQGGKIIAGDVNDAAMKFLTSLGGSPTTSIIQFKTGMAATTANPTTNLAITEGGMTLFGNPGLPFSTLNQGDIVQRHDAALWSISGSDGSHETKITLDSTSDGSALFRKYDSAGEWRFFVRPTLSAVRAQTQAFTISKSAAILINTATDDASSVLTMASTTRGVLFPRMTLAQFTAISSPTTSLHAILTDSSGRLGLWNGSKIVTYATTDMLGGSSGTNYQTVQNNASSLTVRPKLNFIGAPNVSDNSGNTSTDVHLPGLMFSQTANGTAVVNTTTQTTLLGTGVGSMTFGANTLVAGEVIVVHGFALLSTLSSSVGSLTFELLNGFTGTSFVTTPSTSFTSVPIEITATATILTTGSTGTMTCAYVINYSGTNLNISAGSGSFAINTTISRTFDLQVAWQNASTSNSIQSVAPFTMKVE